jgi:CDP-diacylglycerol--glycerol-3-phosphate 3-phosphatidyltransferase
MRSANDWKLWFTGLPNKLTVLRIAAVPVIVLLYPVGASAWTDLKVVIQFLVALVFLAASITDFFDGYLARRYQMESTFGALLDPVADKLLMVAGLILLVAANHLYASIAVVLIGRELAISGLRLIAAERHIAIEVSQFGKLKTVFQAAGIFCLMINRTLFGIAFKTIGYISITVALCLSLYSAYLYCDEFRRRMER